MSRAYERLFARGRRRMANMINRAEITGVDTSRSITRLQIKTKAGLPDDDVPYLEAYGFSSTPLVGGECLVISFGGFSAAIFAFDRRYAIKGKANGDVVIYDNRGQKITLHEAGVTIDTPLALTVNAADSTFNGNIKATGDIAADGDVSDGTGKMQGMRDVYNPHTHPETGSTTQATPAQMV